MKTLEESRKVSMDINKALVIIRHGDLPEDLRLRVLKYIKESKRQLTESYGSRFAIDFDKSILWNLKYDNRVKNYLWYYYRRKSREVPLEKELQVIEALEEKLKLKKFALEEKSEEVKRSQ